VYLILILTSYSLLISLHLMDYRCSRTITSFQPGMELQEVKETIFKRSSSPLKRTSADFIFSVPGVSILPSLGSISGNTGKTTNNSDRQLLTLLHFSL